MSSLPVEARLFLTDDGREIDVKDYRGYRRSHSNGLQTSVITRVISLLARTHAPKKDEFLDSLLASPVGRNRGCDGPSGRTGPPRLADGRAPTGEHYGLFGLLLGVGVAQIRVLDVSNKRNEDVANYGPYVAMSSFRTARIVVLYDAWGREDKAAEWRTQWGDDKLSIEPDPNQSRDGST